MCQTFKKYFLITLNKMLLLQEIHELILYSRFFLIIKDGDTYTLYGYGKKKVSDKKYLSSKWVKVSSGIIDGANGVYFGGSFLGIRFLSLKRIKLE